MAINKKEKIKQILVVAAHPDDEVIGCGGVIARHVMDGDLVNVLFISDGVGSRKQASLTDLRERKEASKRAQKILGFKSATFLDLPDNKLDSIPLIKIIQQIENILAKFKPTIVYTHSCSDLNVDHRITYDATVTACRPIPSSFVRELYSFEIMSSTEWGTQSTPHFSPDVFVDIDSTWDLKIKALRAYDLEMRPAPHTRSIEHLEVLSRHRGYSVGMKRAEAFKLIRHLK